MLPRLLLASLVPFTSLLSTAATSFNIESFEGTDQTYLPGNTNYGDVTSLNSLVNFTANGTLYSSTPFLALRPDGMNNRYSVQYRGESAPLYSDRSDYVTAGTNGLSLTTGANLTTADPQETWNFTRIFLDPNGVGDGIPDFLAADVADNQSDDLLELVDINGDVIASLGITSSDWTQLGRQNLARIDNVSGTIVNANFSNRKIYGLAVELSDFILASNGQNLSSSDTAALNAITNLRISIPGDSNDVPRTDYGWIASNTDTIRFAEQVPEPSSALLLILSAGLIVIRDRRL